ncbi:hypothetical protein SMICM17S_13243 [Streptomyces microflavus]
MRGVARRRDRGQAHPAAGVDVHTVAVGDGDAGEGDVRAGRHEVVGSGDPGEFESAGDVVVVDVGLHHVGDPHSAPGGCRQDLVDVARRVHRHRGALAAGQVAAVAETFQLDGVNEEHAVLLTDGNYPGGYLYPP